MCMMYLVFWLWVFETGDSFNRIEKNYRYTDKARYKNRLKLAY